MSANKQFIAPLPIRVPDGSHARVLDELGARLHRTKVAIEQERKGFLDWLGELLGTRVRDLPGVTTLLRYDEQTLATLLDTLRAAQRQVTPNLTSRAFRDALERERGESLDRLAPLRRSLGDDEALARDAVYDLYEVTRPHREVIDAEYASAP